MKSCSWFLSVVVMNLVLGSAASDDAAPPSEPSADAPDFQELLQRVDEGMSLGDFNFRAFRKSAHESQVDCLAFSPDSRRLVSGSKDGMICLWDMETGMLVRRWKEAHKSTKDGEGAVHGLAFAPDGRRFASAGADKLVRIWKLDEAEPERELKGHEDQVTSVAYSPDGRWLASGGYDGKARVWDTDGKLVQTITAYDGKVTCVAFSPKDGTLFTAGLIVVNPPQVLGGSTVSAPVRAWDVATGKEVKARWGHGCQVAISTDGAVLAAAGPVTLTERDATGVSIICTTFVRVVTAADGREQFCIPEAAPTAVSLSPDSAILAMGYDSEAKTIRDNVIERRKPAECGLREIRTGKLVFQPRTNVGSFAFAPNGRIFAWAAPGRDVHVYRLDGRDWNGRKAGEELQANDLDQLWQDLADEDAAKAFRASWAAVTFAKSATPFLAKRLSPAAKPDETKLKKLIEDLASDSVKRRVKAVHELEKLGEPAVAAAETLLRNSPDDEDLPGRVQRIVDTVRRETLRACRAIQALENTGDDASLKLLKTLAEGTPDATITSTARAALERAKMRASATASPK